MVSVYVILIIWLSCLEMLKVVVSLLVLNTLSCLVYKMCDINKVALLCPCLIAAELHQLRQ